MSPKLDENSLYEQQENKILQQSDAFISLLTKRGILGDHEIDNTRVRNAQQKRRRTAFHNTQVLFPVSHCYTPSCCSFSVTWTPQKLQ